MLDAVFWIARTGSPWRDLPEELGRWASVYKQFLRWTPLGAVGRALGSPGRERGGAGHGADSGLDRRAGAPLRGKGKKGIDRTALATRILDARAVASRPRSTSGRTRQVSLSAS